MLNKTKVLLIVAFFVSVVCCLSVFRSEQITSSVVQAQTDPSRLSLEVSISQENYLKAEPISLKMKLFNQTNQPILWKGFLGGETTDLIATNADGVQFRFDGNEFMTHIDVLSTGQK